QVLPNDIDLLNPPAELEKRKHKLKRLVQSPNSFFMVASICTSSCMICVPCNVLPLLCLAELRCSATRRPSWCAAIARPFSVSPPGGRPSSPRDAPSGERGIEHAVILTLFCIVHEVEVLSFRRC
ncbi:unnamed protein product, partial [Musa hybrid cultivar]